MGRQIATASAAMLVPIGLATRTFANFQDEMLTVKAVTGATGDQFDLLNEKAKELGRSTSFTAAQVAGAMVSLGRAGFASDEIDASIADMLNLARATGTELPEAAEIAAASLRSFGLAANEMGRVADVMTATANNAALTLTDLGESMKLAAPIADEFGLSIEETALAIGTLANFGIKGTMAGTGLRQIMLQLSDPAIRERLEGLGVSLDSFGKTMLDIGRVSQDMTGTERLAFLKELFGQRAAGAGAKLGKEAFEKLADAIDNAAGTAAKTAEVMDSGLGGAFRRLWSAVEGTAISLGEAIAGPLGRLAYIITPIAQGFAKWIEANSGIVTAIVATVAGVGVLGTAIMGLGVAAVISGIALKGLAAMVGILLSPLGLVTVALIGGIATWAKYTDSGRKTVRVLSGLLGELFAIGKQTFGGIAQAIRDGDLKLAGKIAFTGLQLAAAEGLDALRSLVGDTVANIGGQLLSGDFSGAWATAVDGMMLVWESFAKGVVDVFAGAVDAVVNAWQSATTAISDFILESAAQEGVMGDIARSILGVDMRDEQAKAETMDAARKEVGKRNLEWARKQVAAELEQARAVGDDELIAKKEKHLATIDTELAELQTGVKMPDVVADAKKAAAEILQTQADTARETMDQVRKDAEAKQQEAADRLVGRNTQTQSDLKDKADEARRKLDELIAKAERATKDARAKKGSLFGGSKLSLTSATGEGMAGIDMSGIKSTFSAQAAIEMGYGSKSPQQQMAGDIRKMLPKLDLQLGELLKIRLDFQKMVGALKHA